MKWLFQTSALCLLVAVAVMSVAAANNTNSLRVAVVGEPLGTLPTTHFHAPGKILVQHLAEALVGLRNDLSIAPVLADSWSISEDGTVYSFRLRDTARFHNGESVTAEDVAANWHDLYLNDDFPWDCRPYYDGSGTIAGRTSGVEILSVDAVDTRTVIFRLRKPNSLFLYRLADVSCAPVVFHRDSFNSDGSWDKLIGSGPYQLSEWKRGQLVSMVRFEDYAPRSEPRDGYAGAREPLLDEIQLIVQPSTEDAIAALRSGELDFVQNINNRQRSDVLTDENLGTASIANITYWSLLFQTNDEVIGDNRIRNAIAQSIDIDRIAQALSEGRLASNPSVISAMSEYYSIQQAERPRFDPMAARKLIAQSGYSGEVIRIQASRDLYPELFTIASMAQAMMREVGLNVEVDPMTWHELKDDHYKNGTYQMQAFIIGGRISPTLAYGKFVGSKEQLPRFYWDSDQAIALVAKAEEACSDSDLQSIYDQLHLKAISEIPQIVITNREQHDAFQLSVRGIQPTHFGRTAFWGVSMQ